MNVIEIALTFYRLMEEYKLTQERLSERVGKKRTTIANYLRLLRLPAEIQMEIKDKKIEMDHARAILGYPIPEITLERVGASAVVLADKEGTHPIYSGLELAMQQPKSDIRIFGKPTTRPYRRMAVALTYDTIGSEADIVKQRAIEIAGMIQVGNER